VARRSAPGAPEGILLIDKPPGWTSHDVVARARGLTGQRRIGHTGTLDPAATGLLVLCLGRATRLVEYMTAHDKRYEGIITLGTRTDTDDADGQVTGTTAIPAVTAARLRELEDAFTGTLHQRPPAFSAISVGGSRAYASARRGEAVVLPGRTVRVHSLQLSLLPGERLCVRAHCGPGTYIRALARDIGDHLGCGAHLSALRRLSAGSFSVADAVTLDGLGGAVEGGRLAELLLPPDEGVRDMQAALIGSERGALITHGEPLALHEAPWRAAPSVRIYDAAGAFLGIAEVTEGGIIRPIKVLTGG